MEYPLILQMLVLLSSHCIGDFSLQTEFLSEYKSVNNIVLAIHCVIYTTAIMVGFIVCANIENVNIHYVIKYSYMIFIFISHFIIDYLKCKLIEGLEENYELSDCEKDIADTNIFYIDQILHLIVIGIILTLFKLSF